MKLPKVAVITDDHIGVEMTELLLEGLADVVHLNNPKTGYTILDRDYDAIICDDIAPQRKNYLSLLSLGKPIVFLTERGVNELKELFAHAKSDISYLMKPFHPNLLVEQLNLS